MTTTPTPLSAGEVKPLKYMARVTLGKMLQPSPRGDLDEEISYLRSANVQERGDLQLDDVSKMWVSPRDRKSLSLRKGDVVVVEGGSVGRAAVLSDDLPNVVFQNSINRLRPIDADGRFLAYVLQASRGTGFFDVYCDAVSIAHLTAEKLGRVRLPAPTIEEQTAIANYLDRETVQIDVLIAKQAMLIDKLRERRLALVDLAFQRSDFSIRTRVQHLLAARPRYGVLVPRYVDEVEGTAPFVRVGDLLSLDPDTDLVRISQEQSREYRRTSLKGGEVLLGVVGKMGQASIAPGWLAGANVARAVAVLRCREPAHSTLLRWWLSSTHFLDQADLATSGDSIQPTLGMADLWHFEVHWPVPDAAEQVAQHLDHETAKIDDLIVQSERFIELTRERRSALITAAVTGQIDVTKKSGVV